MSRPAWWDWRGVIAGLAIALASTAVLGAVDVRDRLAACESTATRQADVQAERDRLVLYRLERIDAALQRLESKP